MNTLKDISIKELGTWKLHSLGYSYDARQEAKYCQEKNKVDIEGELQVFITNLFRSNIKFDSKFLSLLVLWRVQIMLAYIQ